jgi:hypothetical protein
MRSWHSVAARGGGLASRAAVALLRDCRPLRAAVARSVAQQSDGSAAPDRLVQNTTTINKVPTSFAMDQQLYGYILEHTREPEASGALPGHNPGPSCWPAQARAAAPPPRRAPARVHAPTAPPAARPAPLPARAQVLQQLREETAAMNGSQMQITPEQGAFMALLVQLAGARSVVEVGVFTGYSSLAMALALPEGGRLHAFDRDEGTMAVARR